MKSLWRLLMPLNASAFCLCFVLFFKTMHMAFPDEDDYTRPNVLHTVGAVAAFLVTLAELGLVLYLHLEPICVFPGLESRGKIAIRDGFGAAVDNARFEIGPQPVLLAIAVLAQLVALVTLHRHSLGICIGGGGRDNRNNRRFMESDEARRLNPSAMEGASYDASNDNKRKADPQGFSPHANDLA
jgi:hypothetical protein